MNAKQANAVFEQLGVNRETVELSAIKFTVLNAPLYSLDGHLRAIVIDSLNQNLSESELKIFEALADTERRQHPEDGALSSRIRVAAWLEDMDSHYDNMDMETNEYMVWQHKIRKLATDNADDCRAVCSEHGCQSADADNYLAARKAIEILSCSTARMINEFGMNQVRQQAWQLTDDISQLLGSDGKCCIADTVDLQRGLRALDLEYISMFEHPELAAVNMLHDLEIDQNGGSLERRPVGARSLADMGSGLMALPGIDASRCMMMLHAHADQPDALWIGSASACDADGLASCMTVYEVRIMRPGHCAEELAEKLRQAPDTVTARSVCHALSKPAGNLYKQSLSRGLKKLEMQENMQSLTASQKDDSLSEGLKQGGQGRH